MGEVIPENIEFICSACGKRWITSPGCVGDCLHCGTRIVAPTKEGMREREIETKRNQLKRLK